MSFLLFCFEADVFNTSCIEVIKVIFFLQEVTRYMLIFQPTATMILSRITRISYLYYFKIKNSAVPLLLYYVI